MKIRKANINDAESLKLCYDAVGVEPEIKYVDKTIEVRNYFPFRDYEYF